MTTRKWRREGVTGLLTIAIFVIMAGTAAAASVAASYDGSLSVPRTGETAVASGALSESGKDVSGSLSLGFGDPAMGGTYDLGGKMRGRRVVITGVNASGTALRWVGKLKPNGRIVGRARLVTSAGRYKGRLILNRKTSCDSAYFTGQVMGRVLGPICANCHVPGGAAQAANFRVTVDDPLATQQSMDQHINRAAPERSRILEKPLLAIPHGGGQQLSPGSEQHGILLEWVTRVANGQQCDGTPDTPLVALDPAELLVRASMDVRGRRPSLADLDAVTANPNAYAAIVDAYLRSPDFLERVKDTYDDALLVRREDFSDESRDETWAIFGEALELIAYVVANDRPFTEIGTADYTVASTLFQRDLRRMPFPMEPVTGSGWQPTHYADGRPHAGLLSTSAFYEVWDTNDTNKNRRRANRWSIVFHCYNFLDTPVDVTRDVDNNNDDDVLNAVTSRADCKACHDTLDPLASFLFPMDRLERLEDAEPDAFFSGDPERWRQANRRPPAVYGMPGLDITDMGRLLTQHPRFAECQTKRVFEMLFLREPKTSAELNTASEIASRWGSEDGYSFRALVRRWMLSDVYRGIPANDDPSWVRRVSPERFELLIQDLTGFVWSRDPDDDQDDLDPESDPPRTAPVPRLTTEERSFKIIFGGINGETVSSRTTSLNASVVNVQRKLAALAADYVLRTDLALPDAQRKLLAGVSGDEDPVADEAALRGHMARIARRLYGIPPALDSEEVEAWLRLYAALYADTTQANDVPGTRGERAWRGLLVAMLRSPQIILY